MSLLAPLYVLGALAVAAPFVFHLIRRSPRGEVPFSALMFLSPTPPRLTRRSRLENLFLLLLRATALCLLALAFARPFLRLTARLDSGALERKRVVVLIDTSASMRRGDLWEKARATAAEAVAKCGPSDEVAVLAFDDSMHSLLGFEEAGTLDFSRRQAVARARLSALAPGWRATDLGQALIDAVGTISDQADASEKSGRMPRRIVLVSDLQQGSRLDALGDFEWPADVELELKPVSDSGSNAGLEGFIDTPSEDGPATPAQVRVRVANEPGSRHDSFELAWVDASGQSTGPPVAVYVPPGESRVVRVPRLPHFRSLRLRGDAHEFDNTLYFAPERQDQGSVLYLGADPADDPAGLFYYLQRVYQTTPQRRVQVEARPPAQALDWKPEERPLLVVLAAETTSENVVRLQNYVRGGGTLLYVIAAPGRSETLAGLADSPVRTLAEATVTRDVMLREIAFDHPLFAPLAGAQFNDFTKIHFWKYRRLDTETVGNARVLARFDSGDPAIVEKALDKGRLVVFASGWNPADSQLARSSKFVPLMAALLDGGNPPPLDATNHRVHERVSLPVVADTSLGMVVRKPDGSTVTVAPGSAFFDETNQPGVYTVETAAGARAFAVNLDPAESKTAPLPVETLEQFGCKLANLARQPLSREQLRQMQNAELENRQKLWRWVILAALGVLIVETWLAGRHTRPRPARAEALTT